MVSLDELACFDLLIWLRTGRDARSRANLSQPMISRNAKKVAQLFNISLLKEDGEWDIVGDQTLLNLERQVHQEYRWKMGHSLRIEAQYYSGSLYCDPCPDGWMPGNFDYLEIHTPLRHLRDGVIDAWIACYPDVPEGDDPDLICFHLTRLPTHLVVSENHPLLDMGDQITLDDVKQYPSLALSDGAHPKVQQVLQELGLWNLTQNIQRSSQWQSKARYPSALVVSPASAFTLSFFPNPQVVLPISIPLVVGDTLVVRRDYENHPRLRNLLEHLRFRAKQLAKQYPEVSIP